MGPRSHPPTLGHDNPRDVEAALEGLEYLLEVDSQMGPESAGAVPRGYCWVCAPLTQGIVVEVELDASISNMRGTA